MINKLFEAMYYKKSDSYEQVTVPFHGFTKRIMKDKINCWEWRGEIMVTFCSDVDGTLIYYVNRLMEFPEWVHLQCKNQFMTKESHRLLQEVRQKVEFLPVTARSVEKYGEIAEDLGNPNFALVCNGAVLLADGEIVTEWLQESKTLAEKSEKDFDKVIAFCKEQPSVKKITWEQGVRILITTSNTRKLREKLTASLDLNTVDLWIAGSVLEVVPKGLTKGEAVRRWREQFAPKFLVAAGNGEIDFTMADHAEVLLVPDILASKVHSSNVKVVQGVFSDGVLREVLDIAKSREKEEGGVI